MTIKVVEYCSSVSNGPGSAGTPRLYLTGTKTYDDIFQNPDADCQEILLKPEIVELIMDWVEQNKTNEEVMYGLTSYDIMDPEDELDIPEAEFNELEGPLEKLKHLVKFDQSMRDWLESTDISEVVTLMDDKGNILYNLD